MKRITVKSAVMMVVMLGLFAVSTAPSAFAQNRRARCATNSGYSTYNDRGGYDNQVYVNDRFDRRYNNQYDSRYDSRYDSQYDSQYSRSYNRRNDNGYSYWDRENTAGKTAKRVGIGAGIGAGAGALIGGKKGALIGAGIGAAGGYIYHRKKVSDSRSIWGLLR